MLKLNQKRQYGFTIVELLIVIVVIGILAALVLNSFSGAQKRAGNAQTTSAIEAYKKALSPTQPPMGLIRIITMLASGRDIRMQTVGTEVSPRVNHSATLYGQ